MQKVAHWLLVIGGVNWLLVGILGEDVFGLLGMDMAGWLPRVVYVVVGLAALVSLKPKSSPVMAPQM